MLGALVSSKQAYPSTVLTGSLHKGRETGELSHGVLLGGDRGQEHADQQDKQQVDSFEHLNYKS